MGFNKRRRKDRRRQSAVSRLNRPGWLVLGGGGMSFNVCRGTLGKLGDVHRDKERLVARKGRFGRGALSHRRGDWGAAWTGA